MLINPREIMSILQRRRKVLSALRDKPRSKPELIDECDISRSTIDRSIDDLIEYDLCRRDFEIGYSLTSYGRCTVNLDEILSESLEGLCKAQSNGIEVSMDEPGIGVMFTDAEIVTGEPPAPDTPLQEFCERLRETPRIRGFTPVVLKEFVDIGIERHQNGDLSLDLVITPRVSEYLATKYSDTFYQDAASNRISFHEATLPQSTGLVILGNDEDPTAFLLIFGEGGLEGFIETENRLAIGWAERAFVERRAKASTV